FDIRSMQQRFQGTYLRRSFVRSVATPAELFLPALMSLDDEQLRERIAALYAPAPGNALQQLRALEEERATLEAARAGHLCASC
ncbi:hypothetical protein, partial [Stenotrophomonas sp. SrG]|uniref:hypothetical protein n=1 Tax=Stenotrophomonas sp. SrG TaxID=3414430 RepID=UPI003CE778EE